MKGAVLIAGASILAAVVQAAAAPLFTASAAAPALGVLFLALLGLFRGRRSAMVATPLLAIAEAWLRGVSPSLLLLAYVPVIPLLDIGEGEEWPLLGPGIRLLLVVITAGAWTRLVGAAAVMLDGVTASPWEVVSMLLLPGALIDGLLGGLGYLVLRLGFGEPGRTTWLRWS